MVKSTPQDASLEEEKPTRQGKKAKKQSKITQVFNVKIRPQTNFSQHTHKTKSSKQIPITQESKSPTKYIQTMLKLRRERPSHIPSTTETNNSNKTSINDVIPVTLNNKTVIGNQRSINVQGKQTPTARIVKKFEKWKNSPNRDTQGIKTKATKILDKTDGNIQNSHASIGHGDK